MELPINSKARVRISPLYSDKTEAIEPLKGRILITIRYTTNELTFEPEPRRKLSPTTPWLPSHQCNHQNHHHQHQCHHPRNHHHHIFSQKIRTWNLISGSDLLKPSWIFCRNWLKALRGEKLSRQKGLGPDFFPADIFEWTQKDLLAHKTFLHNLRSQLALLAGFLEH